MWNVDILSGKSGYGYICNRKFGFAVELMIFSSDKGSNRAEHIFLDGNLPPWEFSYCGPYANFVCPSEIDQ